MAQARTKNDASEGKIGAGEGKIGAGEGKNGAGEGKIRESGELKKKKEKRKEEKKQKHLDKRMPMRYNIGVDSASGRPQGYTEMYSRGRRGAPAKGVGRLYRRESSNLSISAKKSKSKDLDFFICAARHNIICVQRTQHHLSVSSTSLPPCADTNERG